ncbi:MAG: family 10 glycosylhydrolase [Chloroherpetonaceae bacterium]|nr:family 10 glycosylhydrolase [Chloroherpetonaceae bacterium]MCS7210350.1 family 10 glycosylhydrolase [Chloroherpetonaceae bacterium]MDW8019375.1 family 10 glycosylhydrolase [Chloroherpetonaceae bacterium]MDW8467000.1 family 10 glycosylhydrolase [Chloroherpetonaceae bacterium]
MASCNAMKCRNLLQRGLAWVGLCTVLVRQLAAQDIAPNVEMPPAELRGVWIATAFGIDFPKSTRPEEQQRQLDSMFQDLKARRFNAVFFQVRIRADVAFETPLEPYHEYFTGVYGKAPAYDIVQYAIDLARKYGLEFHAWFNTMILRGKNTTKKSVGVPSLWERYPEWIDARAHANPDEPTAFLNPAKPEVQAHLLQLILDFARRYDIDGIQLDDYLRYPTVDFPDSAEFARYNPRGLSRADWRREVITRFVEMVYDSLMRLKPYLKFGVTPVGVYRRLDSEPVLEGYALYQDAREWTRRKVCDYLAPQLYFHIGRTTEEEARLRQFNPDFAALVEDWCSNKHFRHLYIGIGVYKPAVKKEWHRQLLLARRAGADGIIFYPYSATAGIAAFEEFARLPAMQWKCAVKPSSPQGIEVKWQGSTITLTWHHQPEARWYNLYALQGTRLTLLQQHLSRTTTTFSVSSGQKFFLTTIDRFGNESALSPVIEIP